MSGDLCHTSSLICSVSEASDLVSPTTSHISPPGVGYYILIVNCQPLYGDSSLPPQLGKKIFRLINDIPFGPGKLPNSSSEAVVDWRYMQDIPGNHAFISAVPISSEAALEARGHLRRMLTSNAREVFSDTTVAVNILLNRCLAVDAGLVVNDIAKVSDSSLVFSQ